MKYKQPLKSDNGLRWKHLPHHNKPRLTMPTPSRSWRSAAAVYTDRRAVSLFLLGLAAGLREPFQSFWEQVFARAARKGLIRRIVNTP